MRTVKLNNHIFQENLIFFHQNFFFSFLRSSQEIYYDFFSTEGFKTECSPFLKKETSVLKRKIIILRR